MRRLAHLLLSVGKYFCELCLHCFPKDHALSGQSCLSVHCEQTCVDQNEEINIILILISALAMFTLLLLVSLSSELVLNSPPRLSKAVEPLGYPYPSCPQAEDNNLLLKVPVWPPANMNIGGRRVQVAILQHI